MKRFYINALLALFLVLTAGCGNRSARVTDETECNHESIFNGANDPASKEVMKRAEADIEKYRKGDFTIRFVDEKGKEIKRAKAGIELFQHQFIFGTNLRWLSDMPDDNKVKREALQAITDIFNTVIVCDYWENSSLGKAGEFMSARKDYEWATRNGLRTRFHAILFNIPQWIPADKKLTAQDYWDIIEFRIKDVAANFGDKIFEYDVMNEIYTKDYNWKRIRDVNPNFPDFTDPQTAKQIFDLARKHLPDAKLVCLESYLASVNVPIFVKHIEYCKALRDLGGDFDYVGHQAHFYTKGTPFREGKQFTMASINEAYDLMASVGKPVALTEFNGISRNNKEPKEEQDKIWMLTDKENAAWQINFYKLAFSKPYIRELTRWFQVDNIGGRGMDAGIIDENGERRQIYYDLKKLIKEEWHTKVEGKTNKKGEIALRGFYGEYDINVKGYQPVRVKLYDDHQEKEITIQLTK